MPLYFTFVPRKPPDLPFPFMPVPSFARVIRPLSPSMAERPKINPLFFSGLKSCLSSLNQRFPSAPPDLCAHQRPSLMSLTSYCVSHRALYIDRMTLDPHYPPRTPFFALVILSHDQPCFPVVPVSTPPRFEVRSLCHLCFLFSVRCGNSVKTPCIPPFPDLGRPVHINSLLLRARILTPSLSGRFRPAQIRGRNGHSDTACASPHPFISFGSLGPSCLLRAGEGQ